MGMFTNMDKESIYSLFGIANPIKEAVEDDDETTPTSDTDDEYNIEDDTSGDDTPEDTEDVPNEYDIGDTEVESEDVPEDSTEPSEGEENTEDDYDLGNEENPEDNTNDTEGESETDTSDDYSLDDTETSDEEQQEPESEEQPVDDESTEGDNEFDAQKEKLLSVEKDLFDHLSPEQKEIKKKELKENYTKIYERCASILELISKASPVDELTIKVFDYAQNTITDLQKFVYDYLINIFDTKTYLENDAQFKQFLTILNTIKNILNEIDVENTK